MGGKGSTKKEAEDLKSGQKEKRGRLAVFSRKGEQGGSESRKGAPHGPKPWEDGTVSRDRKSKKNHELRILLQRKAPNQGTELLR